MYSRIIDAYMAKQAREIEELREIRDISPALSVYVRISEKERYMKELRALKRCFILLEGGTF